ncbi:MAG: MFS transporter [Hyphomicrobiales bacterium]
MIARLTGPTSFAPRIAIFYVAIFAAVGIYLPFFPLWLEAKALSPAQIAIVLAIPMAVRAIVTPVMVSFGDRVSDRRVILIRYASIAFGLLGLLFLANGFWQIIAVVVLVAVFWDTLVPLGDAIALSGVRKFGMDYGQVRLWGSVAFIVANVVAGALIGAMSGNVVLPILFLVYGAVVCATIRLPKNTVENEEKSEDNSVFSAKAFRHPVLLLALSIGALCQASHAMVYGFGSLYWQDIGFSGLEIGTLWAVGVLAEVVLFGFSKQILNRLGPEGLLVLGAMAVVLRWLLFPIHWSFAGYFVLQILHGATFGAAHLGVMHTISQRVPDAQTGRAQANYFFISGVLMAVVTVLSGQLYVNYAGDGFRIMAAFGAVGLVLWIWMRSMMHSEVKPQPPR